jgi:hypothetical protein
MEMDLVTKCRDWRLPPSFAAPLISRLRVLEHPVRVITTMVCLSLVGIMVPKVLVMSREATRMGIDLLEIEICSALRLEIEGLARITSMLRKLTPSLLDPLSATLMAKSMAATA